MDLSLDKSLFPKNLKFWGSHTLINAIPSFILAYIHDWDSVSAICAMLLGIILFMLSLAFFTSLRDINTFLTTELIAATVKAGTWYRIIICVLAPVVLGADFITGLISHSIYRSLANIIPITGVHGFFPTLFITLMQAFFITLSLFVAGFILASLFRPMKKHHLTHH